MRSLAIVRLPSGLDPDDLIAQRGVGAMEKLLSEASTLLDMRWESERDSQPLNTPEAKAGLKARLMQHVDTIEDRDIQSLYRRELLDRFSAFAYPPRQQRGGNIRGNWQRGPARREGLSSEAKSVLQRAIAGGQRSNLLSAVLLGLLRHPDQIARHSESLIRLAKLDRQAAPAIESLIELAETLDSRTQPAISDEQGYPAPPDETRYAFLREGPDPGEAREELAEAVSLLALKPALEAAMAATVARFDDDPEGSIAEQARLRQQLTTVDERLKTFGRRKAASAAGLKDASSSSAPAADDPKPD
jgi:DNA primase